MLAFSTCTFGAGPLVTFGCVCDVVSRAVSVGGFTPLGVAPVPHAARGNANTSDSHTDSGKAALPIIARPEAKTGDVRQPSPESTPSAAILKMFSINRR